MNRLIALVEVVNRGSFTKAGMALGYTQSAVSHMITSLEKDFSVKLLYRSRIGVHLTLEGKQLYPFIQRSVHQFQTLQEKVKEVNGLEVGTVRIGTISSISAHWLPRLIKSFQIAYPKVQFILHQGDYTTIPEWVQNGELDFGFVNPDALPNASVDFIKSGQLKAVLPNTHRLAHQSFVTLPELANEPFLQLEEGAYSEPLEAFHQIKITPTIKLKVHDDYSIMSMIEAGLGVSILPELVLQKVKYEVTILPIKPALTRKIGIIKQDSNTLPIASKTFIDFLMTHRNELP